MRKVIPEDEVPEEWRCANMRPARQQQAEAPVHIEAVSLGALKTFVHHAHPASINIFAGHVICSQSEVRVPFACPAAMVAAGHLGLTSFLMDFAFKTNKHGLCLGPSVLWGSTSKFASPTCGSFRPFSC